MNEITNLSLPSVSLDSLLINLLIGVVLSSIICWHYTKRTKGKILRRDLGLVLPIICLTTILVISVVKSSLALSLGLVGALSIVRFRTPIKEPEELAYIFLAIAIGLSLGADQREVAAIAVPVVLLVISLVNLFAQKKGENASGNMLINLEIGNSKEELTIKEVLSALGETNSEIKIQRIDHSKDGIHIVGLVNFNTEEDLIKFSDIIKENFPSCNFSFLDNFTHPNE